MRLLVLLLLTGRCIEILAQYPRGNYLFAAVYGSAPLNRSAQSVYPRWQSRPQSWQPANQFFFNMGLHFESLEGHFLETYLNLKGVDNQDLIVIPGLRLGSGKNRWRWFGEVNYSGYTRVLHSGAEEAIGYHYGAGFRTRIGQRLSWQASLLRQHFDAFDEPGHQLRSPARVFLTSGLHWKPKIKKLTPRRFNRCVHPVSSS
jgi:hypothetical protein